MKAVQKGTERLLSGQPGRRRLAAALIESAGFDEPEDVEKADIQDETATPTLDTEPTDNNSVEVVNGLGKQAVQEAEVRIFANHPEAPPADHVG